ncbi:MAG: hypothetical protein IKY64_01570 [Bacteroidaceae bacterium]|nr:hypothetical protein [Bacteroidaceae bacterium]
MNKKHTFKVGKYISMACLLFVCATVQSCRDEYYYDDREPEWLGESIYDYLESKGNFTLFMKVIEDLNYKEVLSKTGSKTLFVADDEAFLQGIKEEWGYDSYEQLTPAHKRVILYNAMLDNAYLLELMSNMPSANANSEPVIGRCLRQVTSSNVTDSIGFFYDADLPQNNPDWDQFREKGIRLALDATSTTMVHFLEEQLYQNSITAEDVDILLNRRYPGVTTKDAFIFDKKVIDQNVTCKNGYVHQLDGLLIPPSNMAEEIRTNGKTDIFSSMLDRFAIPYYNASLTAEYNRIYHYGDDANNEVVYEKRYYTKGSNRGGSGDFLSYRDRDNKDHNAKGALFFDPGWNEYRPGVNSSTKKENDMAVIFAPSDEALETYFTVGEGQALIERYGHRDSIPLEDIQYLLRNMMKNSFNSAVPSRFESIMDDARDPMGVTKDHIEEVIIANNGVVYVTNHVYSPARYVAVTAPVMLSDTLKIANWAINQYEYDKYLLSMGSWFSLVVPNDGCMKYLNPHSVNDPEPIMYIFKWNPAAKNESGKVYAETWICDPVTLDTIQKKDNLTNSTQIQDLLKQMYEYYIVVGDFANGNKYHMSKGFGTIKVDTDAEGNVLNIMGGREVALGTEVPMGHIYPQKNGRTYRLDAGMIQPPTQSVYKVLGDSVNHPEFSEFYKLCLGSADVLNTIAPLDKKGSPIQDSIKRYMIFENLNGLDMNVRTFNTYHYTVYVPENDKILEAYEQGLPNWYDLEDEAYAIEEIKIVKTEKEEALLDIEPTDTVAINALQAQIDELAAEINARIKAVKTDVELIVDFVKYHFQDNSVYVDNLPHSIVEGEEIKYVVDYETATLDEVTKRFCTVRVQTQEGNNGPTISVAGDITGMDNTCYVINEAGTEGQRYNIMTRDIEFKDKSTTSPLIETSSYAVVHQIDGFLVNDRIYDGVNKQFIK